MPKLSPLEKWKLMKEGKLDENGKPKQGVISADGHTYKRPGEYCEHPADKVVSGESKSMGMLKICTLCGVLVNDPDEK